MSAQSISVFLLMVLTAVNPLSADEIRDPAETVTPIGTPADVEVLPQPNFTTSLVSGGGGCGESYSEDRAVLSRLRRRWRSTMVPVIPIEQPVRSPCRTVEWSYHFRPYHPRGYRDHQRQRQMPGQSPLYPGLPYSHAVFEQVYQAHADAAIPHSETDSP